MPNFFQKLTGSLNVQDDDDNTAKEDITEEERLDDTQTETEEQGGMTSDGQADDDAAIQDDSDENASLTSSEDDSVDEEGEEDEVGEDGEELPPATPESEGDEQDPELPGQGEGTYTIAQLAKATTARVSSHKTKKRFPSLNVAKEKTQKQQDFMSSRMPEGQLAIDVYETPTDIVIKSTIAGVKSTDLDIGIEDNTVNIRGSRHTQEKIKSQDYFYQECYWGTFSRSIILPVEVDSDKAEASLNDGILTITLPKIIKEKEKKIKIL
ncbi:MAG: hypothetical protein A2827_02815 [Candidatus Spechtbacteria bacterium RIFCSPHIGHO2_01_FULL_43_30]|uniref:SHSP domain-containing protein n=1 Tax=Candidatus Spechtbacteria bacterium RIFCSPHIGHO2_01_FULL_43_30 TaxID=1802158 RepID=A0A1G2H6P1_9BACT|nr:MAG: hypothetical protein A2827_02815 [Candidatus Spechtbacteria bacterium RIFCSPHIGHO2_01_FULL_43_30]